MRDAHGRKARHGIKISRSIVGVQERRGQLNNEGGRTLKIERKRGRKVRDWGRDHAEQAESQPRRVVEDQRVFDGRSSLTIDGTQGERSERQRVRQSVCFRSRVLHQRSVESLLQPGRVRGVCGRKTRVRDQPAVLIIKSARD